MMFSVRKVVCLTLLWSMAFTSFPHDAHSKSLGYGLNKENERLAEYLLRKAWVDEVVDRLMEDIEEDDNTMGKNGMKDSTSALDAPTFHGVQGIKYGKAKSPHVGQNWLSQKRRSTALNRNPTIPKERSEETSTVRRRMNSEWMPNVDYSSVNLFKRLLMSQGMDDPDAIAESSPQSNKFMYKKEFFLPLQHNIREYKEKSKQGAREVYQEDLGALGGQIMERPSEHSQRARQASSHQPHVFSIKELAYKKPGNHNGAHLEKNKQVGKKDAKMLSGNSNHPLSRFFRDFKTTSTLNQKDNIAQMMSNSDTASKVAIEEKEQPSSEDILEAEILQLLEEMSKNEVRDVLQARQNALPLDEAKVEEEDDVKDDAKTNELGKRDLELNGFLDILKHNAAKERSLHANPLTDITKSQNHLNLRRITDKLTDYLSSPMSSEDEHKSPEKDNRPKALNYDRKLINSGSKEAGKNNSQMKPKHSQPEKDGGLMPASAGSSEKTSKDTQVSAVDPDIINQIEARVEELEEHLNADQKTGNEKPRKKLRM